MSYRQKIVLWFWKNWVKSLAFCLFNQFYLVVSDWWGLRFWSSKLHRISGICLVNFDVPGPTLFLTEIHKFRLRRALVCWSPLCSSRGRWRAQGCSPYPSPWRWGSSRRKTTFKKQIQILSIKKEFQQSFQSFSIQEFTIFLKFHWLLFWIKHAIKSFQYSNNSHFVF